MMPDDLSERMEKADTTTFRYWMRLRKALSEWKVVMPSDRN